VIRGHLDVPLGLPLGAVKMLGLVGGGVAWQVVSRVVEEQACLMLGAAQVQRGVTVLLGFDTFFRLCLGRGGLLVLERDVAEERCVMVTICLKATRIKQRMIIIPTRDLRPGPLRLRIASPWLSLGGKRLIATGSTIWNLTSFPVLGGCHHLI